MKNEITVIITGSHIKSHPSIRLMKDVVESLDYAGLSNDVLVLLVHDYSDHPDFLDYIKNLEAYAQASDKNIRVIAHSERGHLVGSIKKVMPQVTTEKMLIMQHDLPFKRSFNIAKVLSDLTDLPQIKHLKFAADDQKDPLEKASYLYDFKNDLFGLEVKGSRYTYTRTPAWTDGNHIASKAYYEDIVFPECPDGTAMECTLNWKLNTLEDHNKYGTYLFGPKRDKGYIDHTDGRKAFANPYIDAVARVFRNLSVLVRKYSRLIRGQVKVKNMYDQ